MHVLLSCCHDRSRSAPQLIPPSGKIQTNAWYRVFLEDFHEHVRTLKETSRVHRSPQLQFIHNITLYVPQCPLTVHNSHVLTRA